MTDDMIIHVVNMIFDLKLFNAMLLSSLISSHVAFFGWLWLVAGADLL